jgi:hypothetical protein
MPKRTCAVCGRVKGPGEMTSVPCTDRKTEPIHLHGGHHISTIFGAGIELTLIPLETQPLDTNTGVAGK